MAVVPALKAAVADFERTSATSHLHKAAVLLVCVHSIYYTLLVYAACIYSRVSSQYPSLSPAQAVVYEVAGYTQQRDKMADTALQTHTSNNCTPARL